MTYKKNNKKYLAVITLFLINYCFTLMAQAAPADEIFALLKAGNVNKAYSLANQFNGENEGDSQFDLAFALSARAVGQYHQAVFAFERVLFVNPNSVDARLGLALTYYDLRNFKAAKTEFILLSQYQLSSKLSQTVQQYIQIIDKRALQANGFWQNRLKLGLGFDSNANNGSSDEFITLPLLGQVRLFDESLETSSAFHHLQLQTIYTKPIDQLSKVYASASLLNVSFSDSSASSKTFASFFAGYETSVKVHGSSYDINANVFYRPLWLDGDDFLDFYGIKLGVSRSAFDNATIGVDFSQAIEDYAQEIILNKQQSLLETWLEKPFYNGSHRFTFRLAKESSDKALNDFSARDFWGLGYSIKQAINTIWHYKASVDYLTGEYNAPDKSFNVVRDESFLRAEFELGYQYTPKWHLFSRMSYLNNSSNLALYEFSRYKIWFGGQYDF
jgi:tetratricopeptide (TPR) repeat protein